MLKKLVVTICRGHMTNAIFDRRGAYSCAVDAFIEVSTELFLPHLSNLSVRNEFMALLFGARSAGLCAVYAVERKQINAARNSRTHVVIHHRPL